MTRGYHYSNTNYILAGMIAEGRRASPIPTGHELVIEPLGLHSTFYEVGTYPPGSIERLAHGYFENPACAEYQPPDCARLERAADRPRHPRRQRSWAQAAGGAISSARDVDPWVRAIFGPVRAAEAAGGMAALVSIKTGEPIADVSPEDTHGFALGLSGLFEPSGGSGSTRGRRSATAPSTSGSRTTTCWSPSRPTRSPTTTTGQLNEALIAVYDALKPAP